MLKFTFHYIKKSDHLSPRRRSTLPDCTNWNNNYKEGQQHSHFLTVNTIDDFLTESNKQKNKWDVQQALKINPTTALEVNDQTAEENRWQSSWPQVKNNCPLASMLTDVTNQSMGRPSQLIQNLIHLIGSSSLSHYLGTRKETKQEKQQQQRQRQQRRQPLLNRWK